MKRFLTCLIFSLIPVLPTRAEEEWRTFTDTSGRTFEGRVIATDEEREEVTVIVKKTNRESKIRFGILSESDIAYVKDWKPAVADPEEQDAEEAEDTGKLSTKLYPRTKEAIRARISEIEKRDGAKDISSEQQKTVNQLNIYRYLSGVSDEVKADAKMVEQAQDAAEACKKNNGLSHDLGHSTDLCNLAQGSTMLASVGQYIDDSGDNNRERRGHRRWCLNAPMGKTGFGEDDSFSAMVAMDESGKNSQRDSWAYPGKGFFPKEYLHGNAWSLYLTEQAPAEKDIKVEVHKLAKRPEKPFTANDEIPGKALPVAYVKVFQNTINFEPQAEPITERGIYWVRITGGGLREGYVVELY